MTDADDAATLLLRVPVPSPDVEIHWRHDRAGRHAIVKHGSAKRYFRMSPARAFIWQLCDGKRRGIDVAAEVKNANGPADPALVVAILARFAQNGLIDLGLGPIPKRQSPRSVFQACLTALKYRVNLRDADHLASRLYSAVGGVIMSNAALRCIFAMVALGFILAIHNVRGIDLPDGERIPGVWTMPIIGYFALACHEVAHALTVKHFGRKINGVGFGIHWAFPIFFVDTSDMVLGTRRERISVSFAGPLSDLAFAGAFAIAAALTDHLHVTFFYLSNMMYLSVLINLLPILETDGYYILADVLDRPNVNQRAFRTFASLIWRLSDDRGLARPAFFDILYVILSIIFLTGVGVYGLSVIKYATSAFFSGYVEASIIATIRSILSISWIAILVGGLIGEFTMTTAETA